VILNRTFFIKKPTGSYCKYYKDLGYDISKDMIEIDINHLSFGSKTKVDVICDYCSINKKISYSDYNKSTKNGTLSYSCKSCGKIKQKELFLKKWGVENPFQVPEFQIKIKEKLIVKYGRKLIKVGDFSYTVPRDKDVNDLTPEEAKVFLEDCLIKSGLV
jgi:ribosomal protein L44E